MSQNIFDEMQLEFGRDKIWNFLRIFSRRCNCNLAKTRFGIVLDYFRCDTIGIWLRQDLELFQNIFDEMQLDFGSDKVWNFLRIVSRGCIWNLARTKFGISLEYFRGDAIAIWLKQDLELSWIIFDEIQLEFG